MAVRSLVRELLGSRSLVVLYAADDPDVFLVTRILAMEADTVEFDFTGRNDHRDALLAAPWLTVVGVSGDVVAMPTPGAILFPPPPSWRRRTATR